MKILELCQFSAGICGVWMRVFEESKRLISRGHEVQVFSSNFVKGTKEKAVSCEEIEKIKIKRFPAVHLGGESFMHWDFKSEALDYAPEIIIAHNYRQPHTTKALKIARYLRKEGKQCKVFLVTHAPFVEGNITRSSVAMLAVKFYDRFIGPRTLNKFNKILPISNWEMPCLINCGADAKNIEYIPNGIPDEFFTRKKYKEENKIVFLGRVSPKKKIETLIKALPFVEDKKIIVEIVGPREKEYYESLSALVGKMYLTKRVKFLPPIFDLKKKIAKLDSAKIYVLPSRVEGMPQSLIEAMARGKIVIGSDSIAIRDLINDGKNGFLFEFDNPKDLAKKINLALQGNKKIAKNARKGVEDFAWPKIADRINRTIVQ